MNCEFCSNKATYEVKSLRRFVCDEHADQCAKMGVVVKELKHASSPSAVP